MARRLRLPGYIVVGYMTVGALLDVVISAQPAQIHDLRWRLGVSTLLTAASGTELLGAVLFLALAIAISDGVAMWVGFALSLLYGLLYIGLAGVFALDSLQLRGQIRPEMLSRYNLGLAWTLARVLFTGLAFLVIASACLRAARALARALDRNGGNPASTLVVGARPSSSVSAPPIRPNIERTKAPTG
ncbi:MAG TPA: hypothetical protein VLN49_11635 [Gemmatimonadaceae bacterium]|nr:hypothetical protein [Gemmatimonadaceae bacterium]